MNSYNEHYFSLDVVLELFRVNKLEGHSLDLEYIKQFQHGDSLDHQRRGWVARHT